MSSVPTPPPARRESLSYREELTEDPPPPTSNPFQIKSSAEELLTMMNKERRFSISNTIRHHDYNDDPIHGYIHEGSDSQGDEGEAKEVVIEMNVNMSPSGMIASHVPLSPQQRVSSPRPFFFISCACIYLILFSLSHNHDHKVFQR